MYKPTEGDAMVSAAAEKNKQLDASIYSKLAKPDQDMMKIS